MLALNIYKKQGYVGGAIYNSDHTVSQTISYDKELLSQIRSSKYLQSNAEGIYRHIQSLLKQDKLVFFCGTPCQIKALHLSVSYTHLDVYKRQPPTSSTSVWSSSKKN